MLRLYLDTKSFFLFIWLKLVLKEQAFQWIQNSLNNITLSESLAHDSLTDPYS